MITCKNDRLLELLWFVGYCIEFPTQLAVRIGGGAEWNRRVMYRALESIAAHLQVISKEGIPE